ncbi:MAG TPA: tetratricopeptide repeat protein [Candidatus Methanoperedens sp.]|nr:tetratricopeptide repeat protein [Candidatus Methanoperedens sp.]
MLTVAVSGGAAPAAAAFKYLKPGMEAAEFTLRALDDREITLSALKQSPVSLLVFWATWSPKSEPALREAQSILERHGAAGLRVVAVNVNHPEIGLQERDAVEKASRDLGLTLAVAFDPGFAACSGIGVVANPSFALLDSRGVLLWDAAGWSRSVQDALREQVEIALGVRKPAEEAVAPRYAPAHKALLNYNLGRTFLRQGNGAKARTLFESAAETDRAWAAPRTLLGHVVLQQGGVRDLARAEELFRAAVGIDPGDVSALTGLGEVLLRTNRLEEAEKHLAQARTIDPAFTPAVAGHALVLARRGRPAEALGLFAQALDLSPRDAAIYAGRAECQELSGEAAAAAADYRRAVEILLGAR